ncbi:diguanylate cyclase [Mesorhizobium sp. M1050]|uniref:diguanylate cyclase domain-containing protein n=1 Tax=Mesorhizobium sp. M1050 TaxID=2957051 RepID=UPI0033385F25
MSALQASKAVQDRQPEGEENPSDWLLRERIRLLEAVVDNFPGGISLFDDDLRMVLCNEQQKSMLDYPPELFTYGFPNMEDLFRFNAERGEYGPGCVEDHITSRLELAKQRTVHSYTRTRPNGMVMEVRGVPLVGGGFVTTYLDVTEQRRNQELVAHMAHHDHLTDLPNRALFNDRLQHAIAKTKRSGTIAVLCLDLDRFKPVNDMFGHQAGDELLKQVADRLRASVREHDTVARLGGDEFAIVQTDIHRASDAAVLATRLVTAMQEPFEVCGRTVSIGTSVGISVAPDDGLSLDELLRKADLALYHSKHGGRGAFSFYESGAEHGADV